MRKLIAVVAMSFLLLLAVISSNVFAESPNDKILNKLDQIQKTLDEQVVPKLDECCGKIGVPRTGQTTSYGPGDDGALQKGVPWPKPRFTDNGNGTVTDNLTGLIWLKDANCFGTRSWTDALNDCNNLKHGSCGLTDFSSTGDWRLPNRKELESLLDFGREPALPLVPPFVNGGWKYWSSTSLGSNQAWFMEANGVVDATLPYVLWSVWPVRDAK